jgi:hypothetical protein
LGQARVLYSSANGDRWELAREPDSGRVVVRHRPNAASGGRASEIGVGEFLARGGHGPEHQELLRLIGTLVDEPEAVPAAQPPTPGGDEEAAGAAR